MRMPIALEPWLTRREQKELYEGLLHFGLMDLDNDRNLPLKSGGKTDIYINIRKGRNQHNARGNRNPVRFISRYFANAIFRLNPDRFVDIPDSINPYGGHISEYLQNMPWITVRPVEKEGRVTNSKMIGECQPGDRVVIFDDVITNGVSKIPAYKICVARDLRILPLVVLVDRQQGWKKVFAEEGIDLDVWAGMTLHDVRRLAIEAGDLVRCDELVEERNPIIVACDGENWDDLLPFYEQIRTSGCILKVNDLLFAKGIENLIPDLQVYGRVMADLKCHDIPNTVENTIRRLAQNPPWAVTVHASGGKEMVEKAVNVLKGTGTKVLVATVLTSIDVKTGEEIYNRLPAEEVRVLARIAKRAGAHGLVCSAEEVADLRKQYPEMTLVTPGIRSAGIDADDQKRVATPEAAIQHGSNYLVMGRQIMKASDPYQEAMRLLKEELKVL
jgi:orotidine-5'-phosphate decarboxylase